MKLTEIERGLMFLMHYRLPRRKTLLVGEDPAVDRLYDGLVQLGLLQRSTTTGAHEKRYSTYTLAV